MSPKKPSIQIAPMLILLGVCAVAVPFLSRVTQFPAGNSTVESVARFPDDAGAHGIPELPLPSTVLAPDTESHPRAAPAAPSSQPRAAPVAPSSHPRAAPPPAAPAAKSRSALDPPQLPVPVESPRAPAGVPPGVVAGGRQPAELGSELIVEMRMGRLARTAVVAYREDDLLLLPALELFRLAEVGVEPVQERILQAWREPEHQSLRVDPTQGRAWIGERELPPEKAVFRVADSELYLGAPLIEELLETNLWVDLSELTVVLEPIDHLPVSRRMERERARASLLARRRAPSPERSYMASSLGIRGATLDWSFLIPDHARPRKARYQVALGAGLLGGALDLGYQGNRTARDHKHSDAWQANWTGVWPDNRLLRQMSLGTIQGSGPRPQNLRGVLISNSPYLRPRIFDLAQLTGWLPPEWDVELYHGGTLIDFARTDQEGHYELTTALEYGQNPMEVIAYGPGGEIRRLSRWMPIDAARIPEGRLEYQASGGRYPRDYRACHAAGNLDIRYGLSRMVTLRGGADHFRRREGGDLTHPYCGVSSAIRHGLTFQGEYVHKAVARGQLGYEPSSSVRLTTSHAEYSTRVSRPVLATPGVLRRSALGAFWRPETILPRSFISLSSSRIDESSGWQANGLLRFTTHLRNVRLEAQVRETRVKRATHSSQTTLYGLSGSTTIHAVRGSRLNGLYLRGAFLMNAQQKGLERVQVALARSLSSKIRLEMGSTWNRGSRHPMVTVSLSTTLDAFRSVHRFTQADDNGYTGSTYADGSVVWNEAVGRLEPFPHRSTGRGGLSGTVFVDTNGNGRRDAGEEPVTHLGLLADDKMTTTDEQGRYSLWNMDPFSVSSFKLMTSSLRNPLLVPHFKHAAVRIAPNGFREINVPMTPGTEVLGRLVAEPGSEGIATGGLTISLHHRDSGKDFHTKTFQDGAFYFLALPPGEYEITVPADELERLRINLVESTRSGVIPPAQSLGEAHEIKVGYVRRARQDTGKLFRPDAASPTGRRDGDGHAREAPGEQHRAGAEVPSSREGASGPWPAGEPGDEQVPGALYPLGEPMWICVPVT